VQKELTQQVVPPFDISFVCGPDRERPPHKASSSIPGTIALVQAWLIDSYPAAIIKEERLKRQLAVPLLAYIDDRKSVVSHFSSI